MRHVPQLWCGVRQQDDSQHLDMVKRVLKIDNSNKKGKANKGINETHEKVRKTKGRRKNKKGEVNMFLWEKELN